MSLTITSPDFPDHGELPSRHSLDGGNHSPRLTWTEVPAGTRSLALIVEDPDVPDPRAPKRIFTHWIVYDLPPDTPGLPEAVRDGALPPGANEGRNDAGTRHYSGPQPPIGRHRYFFKLYALDTRLPDLGEPTRAELAAAMRGHVLAEAQLVGTYPAKP